MRILIALALLLFVGSGLINAESYKSLEITKVDNSTAVVAADGLTLTIDGNMVVLANANGEITRMRADEISGMQFTDEVASRVHMVSATTDGPVEAYTVEGTFAGEFNSLNDALASLSAGTYIINYGKGNAIKIFVGK